MIRNSDSVRREFAINDAESDLQKELSRAQQDLSEEVLVAMFDMFETTGGKIDRSVKNFSAVGKLEGLINEINHKAAERILKSVLKGFDSIHARNEDFFKQIGILSEDSDKIKDVMFRRMGIVNRKAAKGGLLEAIFRADDVVTEIKAEALRAISANMSLAEFKNAVQAKVNGQGGPGTLERHYNRYLYDLYQQYDREAGRQMAEKLDLQYAIYQGGLIRTSRPFCKVRNDRVFKREEVAKFGTPDDKYGGYSDKATGDFQGKTTPYNPFLDLGGYNCRHVLDWVSNEMGEYLYDRQEPPQEEAPPPPPDPTPDNPDPTTSKEKVLEILQEPDRFERFEIAWSRTAKYKELVNGEPFIFDVWNDEPITDPKGRFVVTYPVPSGTTLDTFEWVLKQGEGNIYIHWDGEKYTVAKYFDNYNSAAWYTFENKRASLFDYEEMKSYSKRKIGASNLDKIPGMTYNQYGLPDVSFEDFEDIFADKEYEVIGFWNDDELFFFNRGEKSSVSAEGADNRLMRGSIMTHNHPSWTNNWKNQTSSFSLPDIQTSVISRIRELRAVAPKTVHRMIFDDKLSYLYKGKRYVWDLANTHISTNRSEEIEHINRFRRMWNEINMELRNKFFPMIQRDEITMEEAALRHTIERIEIIANIYDGMTYEIEKR